MFKNKTRSIIAIVGFFVFVIPILFLNYTLDSLYQYSRTSVRESMQETLLESAHKTQKNLEPINYIQNEFQNYHRKLFPKLPNEIVDVRLEKDYAESLYSKELFDRIASDTLEKYSPIVLTVNNVATKQRYEYISPSLKKQLDFFKTDIETFQKNRSLIDTHYITKIVKKIFPQTSSTERYVFDEYDMSDDEYDNATEACYRYITKYTKYLHKINNYIFSDYFGKQLLYPVLKHTTSSQGIHGYYSIIIPQSRIVPDEIISSVLASNTSGIKVELYDNINNSSVNNIQENSNGFQYILDLPTSLISLIKVYKELNNIDKTELLKKQICLSIDFPSELLNQKRLNKAVKVISVILIILYLIIAYKFENNSLSLNLTLTNKLILILSVIIVIPMIGTIALSMIPSQNINEVINNNVALAVNNEINNLDLLNKESNYREVSYFNELKRRISKTSKLEFKPETNWSILNENDINNWYQMTTEICYVDSTGILYKISDKGIINQETLDASTFLLQHTNNLGLITNPGEKYIGNEKGSTFAMALVEKYISQETQENTVGQESVLNDDIISLATLNKSAYILCKDKNKKPYYFLYKRSDQNQLPYRFINPYTNINPFWNNIKTKFANIELGITLRNREQEIKNQWPIRKNASTEINDLLYKTIISLKDSGQITVKAINNYDTVSEWHYKTDDAFVACGVAKVDHNTIYSFYIFLLIPVLAIYTLLLLFVVTGFISVFIKEPMSIYKEAISKLENNSYGITIKSFSADEFNNITIAFNKMSEALRQKEQIKRYVSERLIKSVEGNEIQSAGIGKSEKVTVLSSDIRNFTGTSESHSPAEIVEMLNSYFTLMQQAITEQGGIIDKYIGDAIQAVFYDEENKEPQVLRACKAALSMRKALKSFNIDRQKAGLFVIENGIGIDTDIAITGTIGTANGRKDYSVNGSVIDRAAVIESKTKETTSKILVSNISVKEVSGLLIGKQFDEETMELIDVRP